MAQFVLVVSRMELGKTLEFSIGLLVAIQLGCSSQSNQGYTFDAASAEVAPDLLLNPDLEMRRDTSPADILPDVPTGGDLPAPSFDTGLDSAKGGDPPSLDGAPGSIGALDGSWKLTGLLCNMSPDGAMMQRALTLQGDSGNFFMTRGSCATNIAIAVAYPAAGNIVLTYGAVTCAPADCGCSTSEGRDSTGLPGAGTYEFMDGQLRITINHAAESTCPGGGQTSTWRRLP